MNNSAQTIVCPDCEENISSTVLVCVCGWINKKQEAADSSKCMYILNGVRCPLPGIISREIKGNKWLCRGHYHSINDPELSKAIFWDIQKNFRDWQPPKSWREVLLERILSQTTETNTNTIRDLKKIIADLKKRQSRR